MENKHLESTEKYIEKLKSMDYTQQQIDEVIKFRSEADIMPFDMFTELWRNQKIVQRKAKLKTPRNILVVGDELFYLNHYNKKYELCGEFKNLE